MEQSVKITVKWHSWPEGFPQPLWLFPWQLEHGPIVPNVKEALSAAGGLGHLTPFCSARVPLSSPMKVRLPLNAYAVNQLFYQLCLAGVDFKQIFMYSERLQLQMKCLLCCAEKSWVRRHGVWVWFHVWLLMQAGPRSQQDPRLCWEWVRVSAPFFVGTYFSESLIFHCICTNCGCSKWWLLHFSR